MKMPKQYIARMVRQLRVFGKKGQRRIYTIKIGIVGCGGNGSAVAYVFALAGFATLSLLDFDRLELSNLNRFVLGGVKDVGKYKVHIVKNKLQQMFPGMRIRAYTKDVTLPEVWETLKACDWIIEATDSDDIRRFVQRKCIEDDIPLVSVASGFVFRDGKLVRAGSRANRVRKGDACLECQVLDDEPMEQAHVSLIIPNIVAAESALDMVLREITGYAETNDTHDTQTEVDSSRHTRCYNTDNNFVLFDLLNRSITRGHIAPTPGCPLCEKLNRACKSKKPSVHSGEIK